MIEYRAAKRQKRNITPIGKVETFMEGKRCVVRKLLSGGEYAFDERAYQTFLHRYGRERTEKAVYAYAAGINVSEKWGCDFIRFLALEKVVVFS